MIKARPKYPTDLYGTIYIDNIRKAEIPGRMTYVVPPDRYEVTSGAISKKTILTNLPDLFYN
jgi:hypothetical protein